MLDSPHNNHHKGRVYSVGIEVHLPQLEVRVNQDQHDNHAHEDLYVAIRDAFNAAERQLRSVDKKHRATPLKLDGEVLDEEVPLTNEGEAVDEEAA